MLSFVIPAYNEEKNIQKTATKVSRIMRREGIDCEIVFVNDGSRDATWNRIQEMTRRRDRKCLLPL